MAILVFALTVVHGETALKHALQYSKAGSTIVIPDKVVIDVTSTMVVAKPMLTLQGGKIICSTTDACITGSFSFSVRGTLFVSKMASSTPIISMKHSQLIESVGGARGRIEPGVLTLANVTVEITEARDFLLASDFHSMALYGVNIKTNGHRAISTNGIRDVVVSGPSKFVATGRQPERTRLLNQDGLIAPSVSFVKKAPLPAAIWGTMPFQFMDFVNLDIRNVQIEGKWSSILYGRGYNASVLSGVSAASVCGIPVLIESTAPLFNLHLQNCALNIPENGRLVDNKGAQKVHVFLDKSGLACETQLTPIDLHSRTSVFNSQCSPLFELLSGNTEFEHISQSTCNGISIQNYLTCEMVDVAIMNIG